MCQFCRKRSVIRFKIGVVYTKKKTEKWRTAKMKREFCVNEIESWLAYILSTNFEWNYFCLELCQTVISLLCIFVSFPLSSPQYFRFRLHSAFKLNLKNSDQYNNRRVRTLRSKSEWYATLQLLCRNGHRCRWKRFLLILYYHIFAITFCCLLRIYTNNSCSNKIFPEVLIWSIQSGFHQTC